MRLRALVRTRADRVALVVGGLALVVLAVLALSGFGLAAGVLVFAAGVSAGFAGAGLAIARSRRRRLVAGLLLPAALALYVVAGVFFGAGLGSLAEPGPDTLVHGFFFGVLQPAFGTLAGMGYWSYWDEPAPRGGDVDAPGAGQTPRPPSSRGEALRRELYREPNLFSRLFALPLLAFSALALHAGIGGLLDSGFSADGSADPGGLLLIGMGTAFSLSNAAELLPGGLRKARAVLRGAGLAAFLVLMVSLAAWLAVGAFVTGSVPLD